MTDVRYLAEPRPDEWDWVASATIASGAGFIFMSGDDLQPEDGNKLRDEYQIAQFRERDLSFVKVICFPCSIYYITNLTYVDEPVPTLIAHCRTPRQINTVFAYDIRSGTTRELEDFRDTRIIFSVDRFTFAACYTDHITICNLTDDTKEEYKIPSGT
jgi:hypothetical protein